MLWPRVSHHTSSNHDAEFAHGSFPAQSSSRDAGAAGLRTDDRKEWIQIEGSCSASAASPGRSSTAPSSPASTGNRTAHGSGRASNSSTWDGDEFRKGL